MARPRTEDLTGIQTRGAKVRAVIRVDETLVCHPWVLRTSITNDALRQWRATQRLAGDPGATPGSLAADVDAYLARPEVRALACYPARQRHLQLWLDALGRDRDRASVRTADIDRWLEQWLVDGLAGATVIVRRTALKSFYAALNRHTSAPNPVVGAVRPDVTKPSDRSLDYATIDRLLAAMPETHGRHRPSLSRVRARLMAFTGLPPALMKKIQPHDVNWQARTLRVSPRRKGRGVEARTLDLSDDGFAALQAFHAAHAYGWFKTSSLNTTVRRAAARIGLAPEACHLYDLRHSFLTALYRGCGDLATVARLALHSVGSPVTSRYALGAHDAVDRTALAAFSSAVRAARAVPVAAHKLPTKVTKRRKSFVISSSVA